MAALILRITICFFAAVMICIIPQFASADRNTGSMLNDKIDKSFSALESGLSEEEAQRLKNVTITGKLDTGITVIDAAGVEHDFYDGMWQKLIQIKPGTPIKPLKALGIGRARTQRAVLAAIRKFTGKSKTECRVTKAASEWEIRKFGTYLFCSQNISKDGGIYVWASFDNKNTLIRVGYQAWDPF